MYKILDKTNKVIHLADDIYEAKAYVMYLYCYEELPRLAKILDKTDFVPMVFDDKATLIADGYIEDYLRIEEEV